jgi:hypothetical protein
MPIALKSAIATHLARHNERHIAPFLLTSVNPHFYTFADYQHVRINASLWHVVS